MKGHRAAHTDSSPVALIWWLSHEQLPQADPTPLRLPVPLATPTLTGVRALALGSRRSATSG